MQSRKVNIVVNGVVKKEGKGCSGCIVQLMHGWTGKAQADKLKSAKTVKNGSFEIRDAKIDVGSGYLYVVCNKVESYAYEKFDAISTAKEPVNYQTGIIVLQDTAAASYTESSAIGALYAAYRYAAGVASGVMSLGNANNLALTITKRVISRTRLNGTSAAQKREALLRIHTAVAKGMVKELPVISMYDSANFLKAVDSIISPPLPKSKTNKKDGAEMILVSAGEFTMGDSDIEDNTPARAVTLSGYYIYKNLVTVAQYKKFINMTGLYDLPEPSANLAGNYPVVGVTWQEAMDYAKWAGGDLPTEAEWEKAARGIGDPDKSKYPWGPIFDRAKLWSSKVGIGDAKGPTAVGRYAVSPYGCTDMAGNAMQWCKDHYRKDFWKGPGKDKPDPVNLEESPDGIRVARGGSWINVVMTDFRTATRFYLHPSSRADGKGPLYKDTGFRCVQRKLL